MRKFINLFVFGFLITGLVIGFNSCSENELGSNDDSVISVNETVENFVAENSFLKSLSENQECGNTITYDLIAGQHNVVGNVIIANDADTLYIRYSVWGDLNLTETHVYVGPLAGLPLNNKKNPQIGHFNYSVDHGNVKEYTYKIAISELEDSCFIVAAHAVVNEEETAWANGGCAFEGDRWGWYICEFCIEDCEVEEPKETVITIKSFLAESYDCGQATPCVQSIYAATDGIRFSDYKYDWCSIMGYNTVSIENGSSYEFAYISKIGQVGNVYVNIENNVMKILVTTDETHKLKKTFIYVGSQQILFDTYVIPNICPDYNAFPYIIETWSNPVDSHYKEIDLSQVTTN